ncbi:MAG: TVP38/TMEM64 family protein [Elusimicrobia bacterium]|nr:TVP38/TMEM64 family protein [Elusimicrobiota bacterium]
MKHFIAEWAVRLGGLGPTVFALFYGTCCVLLLPASFLSWGAGFIFGLWRGFFAVLGGAMLGATASFLLGRHFLRGWVQQKLATHPKLALIDRAVGVEGWKIVALTRLCPLLPFNLINYSFGLSQVSFRAYFLSSFVFMIPGVLFHVYFGSLAGDVTEAFSGRQTKSPLGWAFAITTVVLAFIGFGYIGRHAQRVLSRERTP